MAGIIHAQCGYCRKRFALREDQLNRQVRCPHCKTIVKITQRTETASEAAGAMRETVAEKRPVASSRPGAMSQVAVGSKNVAIVWLTLVGLGFIGVVIGLFVVFGRRGAELMPPIGGGLTGQHFERDRVIEPPPVDVVGQGGNALASRQEWKPPPPPFEVKVERVLRGFKDETVTYAVGRVTNNSGDMIHSLKVVVGLFDSDEKLLGEAVAILLSIPPKYTAPLVAEWKHPQGLRATRWMLSSWETYPKGVPRELPRLEADEPWPKRDPNSVAPDGEVTAKVTNHGLVPVRDMEMVAILIDNKGKIVGAAKSGVTKEIKPKASEEVAIRWEHCAGSKVSSVEVWVQPKF